MRALLASPLGFLIGVSLGSLGGGGSILAVPALVYAAGQGARAATGTSLVIVGIAALIGVIPHRREGHVRLRTGVVFGLAGVGGTVLGTILNRKVNPDALLLAFSVLMVVAGGAMLRRARRNGGDAATNDADHADDASPARDDAAASTSFNARIVMRVIVAGSVVGALTGFFGVGGGFVIVPALVLSLGFAMPDAVGTSLIVIAINSAVALVLRLGQTEIDWTAAAPFIVAAALGTVLGGRLAAKVDSAKLSTAFVVLLFAVAAYTAAKSSLELFA